MVTKNDFEKLSDYNLIDSSKEHENWKTAYRRCYYFCHNAGYVHMPSTENEDGKRYCLAVNLSKKTYSEEYVGVYTPSYYDLAVEIFRVMK